MDGLDGEKGREGSWPVSRASFATNFARSAHHNDGEPRCSAGRSTGSTPRRAPPSSLQREGRARSRQDAFLRTALSSININPNLYLGRRAFHGFLAFVGAQDRGGAGGGAGWRGGECGEKGEEEKK